MIDSYVLLPLESMMPKATCTIPSLHILALLSTKLLSAVLIYRLVIEDQRVPPETERP